MCLLSRRNSPFPPLVFFLPALEKSGTEWQRPLWISLEEALAGEVAPFNMMYSLLSRPSNCAYICSSAPARCCLTLIRIQQLSQDGASRCNGETCTWLGSASPAARTRGCQGSPTPSPPSAHLDSSVSFHYPCPSSVTQLIL